ncbi:MAG: hypothetical protein ACRENE_12380, partial [Polyangiaceae bacterium]
MNTRRLLALAVVLTASAAGAGCSLVNSFGDVVTGSDADLGDAGTEGGASDSSGDQTALDGPSSGESGADSTTDGLSSADGGGDATGDGQGTSSDGGTDAPATSPDAGQVGAVVVGGTQGDGGFVLSVLDPTTGNELTRQPMTVVAVKRDLYRDLWYVFEDNGGAGAPSVSPTDTVHLHVYTLQPSSGVWTQQAVLKVPPLVSNDLVTVLNGRLAFAAWQLTDAGAPTGNQDLVLVDTTNQAAPALINPATPLVDSPVGMIGTPKQSGTGGTLNLFHVDMTMCQSDGSAQLCELVAVHVTVPASGAPVVSGSPIGIAAVDPNEAQGYGSYITGGHEDTIA